MLDFIQFINDNTSFTTEEKQQMLDDFCAYHDYDLVEDPPTKVNFVNNKIGEFIIGSINAYRKKVAEGQAEYDEFTF